MFGETMAIVLMIGLDSHLIAICIRSVFLLVNIFQQLEERKETLTLKTSKFNFYQNEHSKLSSIKSISRIFFIIKIPPFPPSQW